MKMCSPLPDPDLPRPRALNPLSFAGRDGCAHLRGSYRHCLGGAVKVRAAAASPQTGQGCQRGAPRRARALCPRPPAHPPTFPPT